MAFPGSRPVRRLSDTAKRVRDELGKGQEILRHASAERVQTATNVLRSVVLIPDVDIVLVGVRVVSEGDAANDYVELIAPAAYDTAPGAANRLISQLPATTLADDTVFNPALLGLNNNVVAAGQPIILVSNDNDSGGELYVYCQVDYILADDERTYRSYD